MTTRAHLNPRLSRPLHPARGESSRAAGAADHLASIDAIRGMAALGVAWLHGREVSWVGTHGYWQEHHSIANILAGPLYGWLDALVALLSVPLMFGSIGVPVFFVLSGYCIHKTQARKLKLQPDYRLDARKFLTRRFVRIYPVLIGALLLTWLLDSASRAIAPDHYKLAALSLHSFFVNLFALQGVAGPHFGSNGALWTLSLEIQFYLVYPAAFALRRLLGLNRMMAFVLLVNIASWFLFERYLVIVFTSYYVSWWLGAYLAEQTFIDDARMRTMALGGLVLIAAGCAVLNGWAYLGFQIWAAGFALLFPWLLSRLRQGLVLSIFRQIGVFSYSLYAVHLPMFVFLSCLFFGTQKPASIMVSLMFLCVVVLGSWLFYLIVERPCIRWLSRASVSTRLPAQSVAE